MATDYNKVISNPINNSEYSTMDEYTNAIFKIEKYKPLESSFLSSSYCGMLELYQDYCKMKKDNIVIDKERREYLSSRSACNTVINLVIWFNGYYEGERFKEWMYQ